MTSHRKPARRRAKPSTALARRPTPRLAIDIIDPNGRLPAPRLAGELNILGEEAMLGALGLVEIKLTKAEEKILSERVLEAEVLIKPTGQPYLSHPSYTRWFNRAFGRLGWAIVPRSKPMKDGRSVVCPYLLYIHGKPAAFAMGEQEYHENNREQTYGDALEATVASALRRCAKRLGVGLELWDKAWLNSFIDRQCVRVWRPDRDGKSKAAWRLKSDRPFWDEVTRKGATVNTTSDQDRGQGMSELDQTRPAAGYDGNGELPITDVPRKKQGDKVGQVQRLWIIVKKSGRSTEEIKAWLAVAYGLDSTKKIKRRDYEAICAAIEKPGPLPKPAALEEREPGEEG